VLLDDPGMTIQTCAKWQQDAPPGRLLKIIVGDGITGRGREWVVMKGGASLEDAYEAASNLGDGVIAARFEEGVHTLIHRESAARDFPVAVPEGFQLVAFPAHGRLSKTARQSLIKLFLDSELIGSMMRITSTLTFREVVEKLPLGDPHKMLEIVANARHAKKQGKHDELKNAIVSMATEIKQYAKLMRGNLKIKHISTVQIIYPERFPDWVPDLEGYYWDSDRKVFVTVTLKDVVDGRETLYMEFMIVLVGLSKGGKSTLATGIAQRLAKAHQYENIIFTKGTLAPFGLMTKAGTMATVGGFVFSDCILEAYRKKPLNSEEKKGFMKVDEDCSFAAPHGDAVMPQYVPRILAINSGGTDAEPDYGFWFDREKMPVSAAVARKQSEKLQNMSSEDTAFARHLIIFRIDRKTYNPTGGPNAERQKRFASRVL